MIAGFKIILHIVRKEFQQFKRDPKMFGVILIAPMIQLIFLGYAATFDLKVINTIIFDQDKSETSRNLIRSFEGSGYFSINKYCDNYNEVESEIDLGNTTVAIVIGKEFEKNFQRGVQTKIQTIFNGSDGNSANIAAGYVTGVVANFSKNILEERLTKFAGKNISLIQIIPESRIWYNPTLQTRIFMVPAIVGLLLSIITLLLTSLAIVKEKEIGTLEQLVVTPIKPHQLILGKLIPFVLLGFVAVFVALSAMYLIFGIGVRGSVIFLLISSFFYIFSTLGLGLLVSTISRTQQQAMMIAIFGVMMPMVYLSGFTFPLENMPEIIQWISYVIPLRYFLVIIRGVILKGIGFEDLWGEVLILFLMGIAILFLSTLRFKKKLE